MVVMNPKFAIESASDVRKNEPAALRLPKVWLWHLSVPARDSPSGLIKPCRQIRDGLLKKTKNAAHLREDVTGPSTL